MNSFSYAPNAPSGRPGRRSRRRAALIVISVLSCLATADSVRGQALGDLRPAWSADGRSIVFQSTRDGNDEIYRLDLETGRTIRLTDHPASDAQPSWSPDGSKVVFVSDRDRDTYSGRAAYQLYVMDSDGSGPRRLAETEWADFMPRWSPDGQWIAFLSDRRGSTELYLMSSDGGDARPIVPQDFAGTPGNPSWSPDSRRVAFDASVDSGYDIYSVGIESGDVANHTRSPETEWYPAWSPTGGEILAGMLAGSRNTGTHVIVAVDLSSGERSVVTRPTPRAGHARDWWPSWSPDAARIVFASRRDGPWRLFVIGADGSGERRLPR